MTWVLDVNGQPIPAAGGWNDAGDLRKWLCFTLFNTYALVDIYKNGHPAYREKVIDKLRWGNIYFHSMINTEGLVYEDLGAGDIRPGTDYENDWWWENHPGVSAIGTPQTDSIPLSGDERKIRTTYNPWVQFGFVRNQCTAATVMTPAESNNCLILAKRAWDYSQKNRHDGRTLFASAELHAALELHAIRASFIAVDAIETLINNLLELQDTDNGNICGFFYENREKKDGFRSIAFNGDPAWALLRVLQVNPAINQQLLRKVGERLKLYLDSYLCKDATSNPFSVTPYGVYINPPQVTEQTFRPTSGKAFIRTTLHPLNTQQIPHGCNSVWMSHANVLAQAGKLFKAQHYIHQAERLLHWALGHNPQGLCCFTVRLQAPGTGIFC